MKKLCINFVTSTLSLWLVSLLVDNMYFNSFKTLLILSITLGILNVFVKPILKFFSFPITVLSLGLFSFVINAVVLKLAFYITPGATLTGIIGALIASILLSITNSILDVVFK